MANKSLNSNLHKASKAKKDEFYTQLIDIEKELKHYKEQFRGKVVYCNCDDPFESNFFKYFAANFNALGLKKLITTSFTKSPIAGGQLPLFEVKGLRPKGKEPFKIELNEVTDTDADGAVGLTDVKWLLKNNANIATPLKGDGDFRSEECIGLLGQADIVVTNPPFSLFREYVAQLVEHDKKFLILGDQNAITYKEIFKLIKNNKAWLGVNLGRGISGFVVPDHYELYGTEARIDDHGNRIVSPNNCLWLTNLDNSKRHKDIPLVKKYIGNETEYSHYDNYNGINVNKTKDIPLDYRGAIGVPITFLHKFNPEQFEIIKFRKGDDGKDLSINGKCPYFRILIKKRKVK